ncbi:hypothetical protein LLH06_02025 [Mucilaginibacter daejeonensis]|uniref:hypothetical protein n=1 Tax=Mucilaginibacter daejeonensis TaxID=398049 RepID=UPI001D17BA2B|nr:hypothetical protein [Mucilaginibacter daejeonensis]UEG53750.1 hypothetical protein LLH06_02025 [Mucilaginibacter daejeonensis]
MARPLALASLFTALGSACYAQMDTVVTNNQKIACAVKEITPDAVKYTYPGEDVVNTVYKNAVQKIIFKSGRVQTFAENTSFRPITSVKDWNNVTITSVEGEVKGLYKFGEVSSKSKGTTIYSSQERVKDRAYRKIKIQAAMLGANTILITNQRTEGNKYGGYFTSGSSAETNLTGIAYSNVIPDLEKFKSLIGDRKQFTAALRYKLGASDADVSIDGADEQFDIDKIVNDNGVVSIEGKLNGENNVHVFQLANFTNEYFSIGYRYKGTAYNYVIKI